jgi:hypothetical protein
VENLDRGSLHYLLQIVVTLKWLAFSCALEISSR